MKLSQLLEDLECQEILEAIRSTPELTIKRIFAQIRQREFDKILGTEDSGLTGIKQRVRLVSELESELINIRKSSSKQK